MPSNDLLMTDNDPAGFDSSNDQSMTEDEVAFRATLAWFDAEVQARQQHTVLTWTPLETPTKPTVDQGALLTDVDQFNLKNPKPLSDVQLPIAEALLAAQQQSEGVANSQMTPSLPPGPMASQGGLAPKDLVNRIDEKYAPKKRIGPQKDSAAARRRQHEKENGLMPKPTRAANRKGAKPAYKVACYDHKRHCRNPSAGCRADCKLLTNFRADHDRLEDQMIPKWKGDPEKDPWRHLTGGMRVRLWEHVNADTLTAS